MLSFCAALPSLSYSQTKTVKNPPTGSISGRVTVGGKGRGGIFVGLRTNNFSSAAMPPHKAVTDADGNYRIVNLLPGTYYVAPMSPLFVLTDSNPVNQVGTPLLLSEGENVDDINFAMARSCVITGRVTEPDGRPVIEQRVSVVSADQPNQRQFFSPRLFQTDDRGVYRMFGLRAGRYKVVVGQNDDGFVSGQNAGRIGYPTSFYPNVTSAEQAKIVELAEGDQASNIDIVVSRTVPGFAVTGIIVNADTNEPINNLYVGLRKKTGDRNSYFPTTGISNQKGEFRLENIPPGTYSIYLSTQLAAEIRAEPLEFQVVDQEVTGIVVRTTRGATISGTAVVEGSNGAVVIAKLRQLQIYAWVQAAGNGGGGARPSRISPDGSFRLTGLPPGIVNFDFAGLDYSQQTGFIMSRIERDGVPVPRGGFDIKAAEQISGVRIVFTYGTGTVRGTLNFENGPAAPGLRFFVRLSKPGDNEARFQQKEVDTRGRFLIENVSPGTYDLHVNASSPGAPDARGRTPAATQSITVADGAVTEVVISIDLAHSP